MRLLLFTFVICAAAQAQQDLKAFLALTPAQNLQVQDLNKGLDQFENIEFQRYGQIYQDLDREYGKPSPDPLTLGQRNQELAAIAREIIAQQVAVQAKIQALLTAAQKTQLQLISSAAVQGDLIRDASCVDLALGLPNALLRSGDFSSLLLGVVNTFPTATIGVPGFGYASTFSGCASVFPISIRNYLMLTDAQVGAIQNILIAYQNLNARKQSRVFDVQTEIRDETAKPVPDPLALGLRYSELSEIAQELRDADAQSHVAAQALLTQTQSAVLQQLTSANRLTQYIFPAESCHFITPPPGTSDYSRGSCANYF
jgi:hypothetical protein